ncbi:hypothetical protein FP2506_03329 [Fulvimarina pelagi HTCC2506]|uniref:DUF58 domain-containing protein n=2 Tax=Fulvimarina pelagi TaxID=217511 RepID=Q0G067_9HYPH|nr:DUF58 domain-containing protein [Fulvimarina pelagi]EAU40726.1 hypothetical protein FP2506_03329 [Fulvimarina pelagi HTCC2506]BAT31268.1 hypothetical protein [Fulvimarina pelagi]
MALPGQRAAEGPTWIDAEAMFAMRHIVRNVPERLLNPTGRPGGYIGKKRGNGLEIVDVRLFSEGDDARHIDAAATARTAKTHVRTFRDERDRAALLIADFRSAMLWGTKTRLRSVAAAGALALVGWRVIEGGGRVSLMAEGCDGILYLPPRSREHAMAATTAALEQTHRASIAALEHGTLKEISIVAMLEQAIARSSSGTTIVLASSLDDADAEFDQLLLAARRRFDIVVLLIRDRFEKAAPRGAYPYLVIGEPESASMRWAFVPKTSEARQDVRIDRLRSAGIDLRVIDTDADWTDMARVLETVDGPRSYR